MSNREEIQAKLGELAVMQALHNATGSIVATKTPYNLRGEVDALARQMFEDSGAKSFEARVNGFKVGTYSITVDKDTEERRETVFDIVDPEALDGWDFDPAFAVGYARMHIRDFAHWYFTETGELPRGCELSEVIQPARPGGNWKSSRLVVEPQKVADALGSQLDGVTRVLLEGGVDG